MNLRLGETADALRFLLRLTEIRRWTIVATAREQSVAEHSFRVAIIAQACYDYMENGTPHNSYDRIAIASFSTIHDVLEVLTGDQDSTFKRAMAANYPHAYDETAKALADARDDAAEVRRTILAEERAAKGSVVEVIVKVADMLEAILFLRSYGINRDHACAIIQDIMMRLHDYVEAQKKVAHAGASINWARVSRFCDLVLAQGHPDAEPTEVSDRASIAPLEPGYCGVSGVAGICQKPRGHDGDHLFRDTWP